MRIDTDQWGEIMDSLTRNKARTFLTAFGIFWGVFMLMILMGGGQGLQLALGKTFAGFASNSGFIMADQTSEPYAGFQTGRRWKLQLEDMEHIKNLVPEIDIIAPLTFGANANVTYQDKKSNRASIKTYTEDYGQVEQVPILEGRLLNEADNNQRRKVCIIGKRIKADLFPDSISPVGKFIKVDGVQYQIVGVNNKDRGGLSIGGQADRTIYLPYRTLVTIYNRHSDVDLMTYTVKEGYTVSQVQDKVADVLKRIHKIHPDDTKAVQKINAEAIFQMIDSLFKGISILVWMIGLGTLIAGAIGVSNIMMVTVRERTSEIGIRRAIGATPTDILVQTMSESLVLTLAAGLTGICCAVGVLAILENNAGYPFTDTNFQVPFWTAMGAAFLLSILGVLAGTGPTLRAMSIKPVDAMREE